MNKEGFKATKSTAAFVLIQAVVLKGMEGNGRKWEVITK